jgi:hypothetical protein
MIRKISPEGVVSTLCGTRTADSTDGVLAAARFSSPCALAFSRHGILFVVDGGNHRIRSIDLSLGTVLTFAGSSEGLLNGPVLSARFVRPISLIISKKLV